MVWGVIIKRSNLAFFKITDKIISHHSTQSYLKMNSIIELLRIIFTKIFVVA